MAAILTPDRSFHLSWDLTAACGLHCRFCYSDVGQSASEESKELVDLALDNIIEMRPLHLGIGGGDPLLSPFLAYALEQLVDRLGNAMPVVTIDTMMLGRKPEAAVSGPGFGRRYGLCLEFLVVVRTERVFTQESISVSDGVTAAAFTLVQERTGLTSTGHLSPTPRQQVLVIRPYVGEPVPTNIA